MSKKALGKGLGALLGPEEPAPKPLARENEVVAIPLGDISASSTQPRQEFKDETISELAESIKAHGVLQPLVVREGAAGGYSLIVGERRYRAAKAAGLDSVPCLVRTSDELEAAELALIENVQREDLSPLDEAQALSRMVEEYHYTQEKLAAALGKSRSYVANSLRLLSLPGEALGALRDRSITPGHARAILSLSEAGAQAMLLDEIITKDLSVRQTEELAKRLARVAAPKTAAPKRAVLPAYLRQLEDKLRSQLGTKVKISPGAKGGSIQIDYYSEEDLERILQLFIPEEEPLG